MAKRIFALLVCQLVAISLFCAGFFPQKKVLKGDAKFLIEPDLQSKTKPVFSKFVLVVIDALRSDFVFEESKSHFFQLHSLLEQGNAWGFTAFSNPPTVTLPRLKGITTGSTPNFLDAILNVAEGDSSSNLNEQDSWVKQFVNYNKRIRFFGDDTWLKLFPLDFFDEYEGTNSFFVSDFEQVDHNVTRHISEQLMNQEDWDVLILHYLGLDHIGHKGGSDSQFMPAKHQEMDEIIGQIYENSGNDTLICVMGDHGMNDNGNHGGSSSGETSAAMVLMSKKLQDYEVPAQQKLVRLPVKDTSTNPTYQYLTSIQQVDLVPTLATLFNFPIPKNSVGVVIRETLQLLDDKLAAIKVQENFRQLQSVKRSHKDTDDVFENLDATFQKMRDIQSELMRSATDYNYEFLYLGLLILLVSTMAAMAAGLQQIRLEKPFFIILTISLIVGLSSFGSSFVEEEHQIWWWIATGGVLLSSLHLPDKKFTHLIILLCLRIIRGWNNSGQKHFYENTIFEILKRNPIQQWYLNFFTIFGLGLLQSDLLSFVSTLLVSMLCFVYKVSWSIVNRERVPDWMYQVALKSCSIITGSTTGDVFEESLVPVARLFYKCFLTCILINLGFAKLTSKRGALNSISTLLTMLLVFQSPSSNIPMFLAYNALRNSLTKLLVEDYGSSSFVTSITSLVLQYFTFFHFGGTNSIATVDLSNAYHGVSQDYNIYLVGFMMCLSNFVPSIYWSIFTWRILYSGNQKWNRFSHNKLTFFMFNCVSGCALLLACLILRFHLFIWSVFSPKLCYYAAWNIFMNLVIGWILEIPLLLMN
ncbi:hypothetical protein HG536_0F02000 [Torulaspora globosa]|uniref:GPI ethanolamine phosphate transferase 2 n=1 Tax=Torulaspora globosa TaxID=48254 RepID=A0A7G3ZK39_9SACH|nr:uncharacterized protein HG536_0F02000 [Torulaspora globosa]QLL33875.1 hypothetical protein HG536_0F02000 [Torulaspora globosa]